MIAVAFEWSQQQYNWWEAYGIQGRGSLLWGFSFFFPQLNILLSWSNVFPWAHALYCLLFWDKTWALFSSIKFPTLTLCKKKISRHIKLTVYACSTKCWRNQKLIAQFDRRWIGATKRGPSLTRTRRKLLIIFYQMPRLYFLACITVLIDGGSCSRGDWEVSDSLATMVVIRCSHLGPRAPTPPKMLLTWSNFSC